MSLLSSDIDTVKYNVGMSSTLLDASSAENLFEIMSAFRGYSPYLAALLETLFANFIALSNAFSGLIAAGTQVL